MRAGSKSLGWILHRLSNDDNLNIVPSTKLGCDMRSKSIEDELLSMWVGYFIIFLSPYWVVRFAILESSVTVLSFLYNWLNFTLKSSSAITKKGFV